jgi:hypothetical protein
MTARLSERFHGNASDIRWHDDDLPRVEKVGKEGYIHGFICVRPPCGEKPGKLRTADLSVHRDGTVLHKPSGYQIGNISHDDDGKFTATHSDSHASHHGDRAAAVSALASHYNTGKTKREDTSKEPVTNVRPHVDKPESSITAHLDAESYEHWRALTHNNSMQLTAKESAELRALKSQAVTSIMHSGLGLPKNVASVIAGPELPKGAYAGDLDLNPEEPLTLNALMSSWTHIVPGHDTIAGISARFDRAMAMKQPDVHEGDFAGGVVKESHKYIPQGIKVWRFNDNSPEAQQRRTDVALYYGMRAQQMYTEATVNDAVPGNESISVIRGVFGDYAHQMLNASKNKEPWQMSVHSLSSWAQPTTESKKSVGDFVKSSALDSNVAWLSMHVPRNSVFAHWRGEGYMRDGNIVLGEVIPVSTSKMLTSNNVTVSEKLL